MLRPDPSALLHLDQVLPVTQRKLLPLEPPIQPLLFRHVFDISFARALHFGLSRRKEGSLYLPNCWTVLNYREIGSAVKRSGMFRRKYFFLFFFLLLLVSPPAIYFLLIPIRQALQKKNPGTTALMEIREMEWKEKGIGAGIYQVWVPLAKNLHRFLTKSRAHREDDKFWKHEGFDYEAHPKGPRNRPENGGNSSTAQHISQQLVKNLYLSPKKSILRKFAEVPLTWKLERTVEEETDPGDLSQRGGVG